MAYERGFRKPHYLRVADELRDGINANRWGPGDLLPSEAELCQQYGVSRGTAVKAIDLLQREGLAHRKQGVGTFVSRPALHRMPGFLSGFSETVRSQGMSPSHKLIEQRKLSKSAALQFGCDQPGLLLKRIRLVNGAPWAIHLSIIPASILKLAPMLTGKGPEVCDFSLYKTFEEHGVQIDHADEAINARLATPEEADLLSLTEPTAVMVVHRTSYDHENHLVEISEATYLGDCYTYDTHLVRAHSLRVVNRLIAPDNGESR